MSSPTTVEPSVQRGEEAATRLQATKTSTLDHTIYRTDTSLSSHHEPTPDAIPYLIQSRGTHSFSLALFVPTPILAPARGFCNQHHCRLHIVSFYSFDVAANATGAPSFFTKIESLGPVAPLA
ncbi:unnamed protein product [Linum trigynum]|uniref:Uncharacterized protein n=1 Tax=Linum trigynum TaxID=586398 RepID=A0AAV2FST4_9ROSI